MMPEERATAIRGVVSVWGQGAAEGDACGGHLGSMAG